MSKPQKRRRVKNFDQALQSLDKASSRSSRSRPKLVSVRGGRGGYLSTPLSFKQTIKGVQKSMSNLQNVAKELKDKSVEKYEEAKLKVVDGSKHAAKKINQEAHRRPWHFMGIAALFSGFFGFLMGRKTKRK